METKLWIRSSFEITGMVKEYHRKLDAVIELYQKLKETSPGLSRLIFHEFKTGLEDHMAWEEGNLFSWFEAETTLPGSGPTEAMRKEHNQMRLLLQEMQELLEHPKNRTEELEQKLVEKRLMEILKSHEEKEEELFLPWLDTILQEKRKKETTRTDCLEDFCSCGSDCGVSKLEIL